MSVQSEFEKEFYEEEFEVLALLKESSGGGAVVGDMLKPSVHTLAMVDLRTNILCEEKGRLEWMIPNSKDRKGWGYDFEQFCIYHLKVRKAIKKELMPYQSEALNNRYMVIQVMEDEISHPALEDLQKYYSTPVVIEHKIGTFTINRQFNWFEGKIDWDGVKALVFLSMSEGEKDSANASLAKLEELAKDFQGADKKYREFAAEKLTELANDWLVDGDEEEPEEISKEEFAKRIEIREVCIGDDGMTLYYNDDDMFWGHSIEITIDEEGNPEDADIVG